MSHKKSVLLMLLFCVIMLAGCSGKPFSNEVIEQTNENDLQINNRSAHAPYLSATPFDGVLYNNFYQNAQETEDIGEVRGAIVPHHLVAGEITASLFKKISEQKPSLIIIFGPNHDVSEKSPIVSAVYDWQTPFGSIKTADKIINHLAEQDIVEIDNRAIEAEHSISSLTSFVSLASPKSELAVFMSPFFTSTATIQTFIDALNPLLPESTVVIASVDFSHYLNYPVADFHDELSKQVVRNFDYNRLAYLDIDSPPSLYFILKMMEFSGFQKIGFESSSNSALIFNQPALDETTSYYSAYFIFGEPKQEKITSLLNFGDIMLDRSVKQKIDKFGFDYILNKLAGAENRFFMGSDIIHANLEGPFANYRRNTSKEIAFCFNPILIKELKKYNFNMLNLANNHSLDMGLQGFEESKNNLRQYDIEYYGNQYRVNQESMIVKKVGDFVVAFIGLNDTNTPLDLNVITDLVKQSAEISDYTVINIHWGEEYKMKSNNRQKFLAHNLIDAGADVIIGHHPHVVQEIEIYNNRPIFYSLGNFIFDQYFSTPTQQSLAVGLLLKTNSITAYIYPLEQNQSQVFQMPYEKQTQYLSNWFRQSNLSNDNMMNKITINL